MNTQVLEVIGRMDGSGNAQLVQMLDHALGNGFRSLVLELSGVEYINSAGLRELVALFKRTQEKGGKLSIANPTERVKTLLELVGLDTIMEIQYSAAKPLNNHIQPSVYYYA